MIVVLTGLIVFVGLSNSWYYKYRTYKGPGQPKEINLTGYRGRL